MTDNYLWNLIVFIILVAKDNQIIVLLLSKLFFAGNKWQTSHSGVSQGGPSLISSEKKFRQKQNNYLIIFRNQNNKHNQIP